MSAHLAKGPLSSAMGQWAFVGLGAYAMAGGEALQNIGQSALKLGMQLASGNGVFGLHQQSSVGAAQQPIVIHSVAPSGSASAGQKPLMMLVQLTIGAGVCWGSYIVFTMFLPEQIKEMLPVTRKFFDAAVTSLGNGILQVRDSLTEQILGLSTKQDELADKQDETHVEVLSVRNDLGEVRFDLNAISETVARCEDSLCAAERRQSYTARGVRLLVRCVGAMMPGNARLAGELERFSQEDELAGEADEKKGAGSGDPQQQGSTPVRQQGENPQSQTPYSRTPSYVTPGASARASAAGGFCGASISSVETDPENAGHEEAMVGDGGNVNGNGSSSSNLPPPTPQDLDEVRMLLDMVRRGGTISVK